MKKLLIVEDNDHKRGKVTAYLRDEFPELTIVEAHSFTSGCQAIDKDSFDVILMDMSLPTYDKSPSDSGGRFRTFGGREIARKIMRRSIPTRLIFLTQYDAFSDKTNSHTLESLALELEDECGNNYFGLLHYDSSKSSWREQLRTKLSAIP